MAEAKKLDGTTALGFLWKHGQEHSEDYRTAPVGRGPGGHQYMVLMIRRDPEAPGDRITQPNRNTGTGGGNLGFAAAFSKNVTFDFGDERGPITVAGKYAISDSVSDDWVRFGEERDNEKWSHLKRAKKSSKSAQKIL